MLIFVLTSAVNVGAVVDHRRAHVAGVLPGSRDPLLTLLPAVVGDRDDRGHARAGRLGAAGGAPA